MKKSQLVDRMLSANPSIAAIADGRQVTEHIAGTVWQEDGSLRYSQTHAVRLGEMVRGFYGRVK
jgi:hypothetical protein